MKRDAGTLDLFNDFAPQNAVARFAAEQVSAPKLNERVARAIARTLKDHAADRATVAKDMSAWLDEPVSKAMLDAYASQARADHNIPAHRLIALVIVTGDARPLNALLADAGLVVVDARYEALIRRELLRDAKARLEREEQNADAEWRARPAPAVRRR